MSATVDLAALAIETPVAHLTSPRTPAKVSSKILQSPQADDMRPTFPTIRFGLISDNGKRFGYSTMNAGFQVSEYLAGQDLPGPGCFQNGSAVSSALSLLISGDKTESKEHSKLLQPLDEENHELSREICSPINVTGVSDVLNNDSKTSVASSRLVVQQLAQSPGLINNFTKNGNSYSPAGNGDSEENGRQQDNVLEITTDDHNEEWSDNDEDEIECGDCCRIFCNIQSYMDHTCCRISEGSKTPVVEEDLRCNPALCSFNTGVPSNEAVRFLGKIIFTQNGSAYVIEDTAIDRSALTELGNSIMPNDDGSGVLADAFLPQLSSVVLFPKMNSSLVTSPGQNMPLQQERTISNHLFYSYHVFDIAAMATKEILQLLSPAQDDQQMPHPVVMCFICRLIFRKTETFFRHVACAHSVDVAEEKRSLLCRFNNSVVCHTGGNDKQRKLSMLVPMHISYLEPRGQDSASVSCRRKLANFVASRRSSDCERRMSFCDNMENSYTYPNKVCKIMKDAMMQAHFIPGCEWTSNLDSAKTSSSQFTERKMTNENSTRVSSPAPSIMTGWYSLPSNDSSQNCPLTVSGALTSPSTTQTAVACCSSSSPLTKVSVPPSSICSLSTPLVPSNNSVMVSNQNDIFSTAPTLSTSNCVNLSGFSCTCEQHSQERTDTEECPKDTGLDSALYLVHNSALNHSRNSCKTLKCPKCNWHYKYQETLDIHMKEKHPDNDAQCVYCLTTQTHPRLTRGESYACGYKPYRCEVCNYSTTTKGNLSIHMQSDKHINNMQDLTSGSPGSKMPSQHPHSNQPPVVTSPASLHTSRTALSPNETLFKRFKQKQSFRCDICNYETSLGRNLRIHITSEKHAHNLFVLNQSFSHLSQDAALDQVNSMLTVYNQEQSGHLSAFRHLPNSVFHNDNGSLLVSGTASCSLASQETTTAVPQENGVDPCSKPSSSKEADVMFKCCMCNRYGSDKLEDVHNHIQKDRNTATSSDSHMSVTDGDYYCNLCSYKTHLKANFHLHCKTDKHLYKLQAYNHILEGGPSNEWKLSCPDFPWQICCNPCRIYANSTHNMQIHVNTAEHEARASIFRHLQELEREAPEPAVGRLRYYRCSLCGVNVLTKTQLVAHARNPQHVGKEELRTPHQAPNSEVYLLKEVSAGVDVDFLREGVENNVKCADVTETRPFVCSDSSTNNIVAHPAIVTSASATATHSNSAESLTPLCSATVRSSVLERAVALPQSGDDVEQECKDGAKYEKAMKSMDVSLPSTLNSGGTTSLVKAEIATPSSISFSSCTNSGGKGSCNCSSGGCIECSCSHCPSSLGTVTLLEEELHNSGSLLCPLCRHDCRDVSLFEEHLVKKHNVTKEGMQRLISMVIIPSSVPSTSSSALTHKATNSLHADVHQISTPSSSSAASRTCKLTTSIVDSVDRVQSPTSARQMIPSPGDVNSGEHTPHLQLKFKTDPTINSLIARIQDSSSQASLHLSASPRPSTTSSPQVTSSPAPEAASSITPSCITISEAIIERMALDTSPHGNITEVTSYSSMQGDFLEIDLQLVDAQHVSLIATEGQDLSLQERLNREFEDLFNCQTCSKHFSDIDRLYDHQNELGHLELTQTPQGPGYLCWKKGCGQYFKTALTLQVHFREIHSKKSLVGILSPQEVELYKFSCEQCSFSFKTLEALKKHSFVHLIQSVTQCRICSRRFSCKSNMKRHLETGHTDLSIAEIKFHLENFDNDMKVLFTSPIFEQFTSKVLMANGNTKSKVLSLMNEEKNQKDGMMINDFAVKNNVKIHEEYIGTSESVLKKCPEKQFVEEDMKNQSLAEEHYKSKDCKFICHTCLLGFANQNDLLEHIETSRHESNEKKGSASVKVESYKCDVCKESFKQENELLQHCNSTGHQMKLKQKNLVSGESRHLIPSTASRYPSSPSARVNSSSPTVYDSGSSDSIHDSSTTNTKSFKCNVCLVNFNNQTGFEIHLRSVGHKTKANKLGELILSGLASDSQTLIQHPDPKIACRLQAQLIADMIHQQATAQAMPAAGASYFNLQNLQGISAASQLSLLALLPPASHALYTTPAPNPLVAVSNAQMEACLTSITTPAVKFGEILASPGMSTVANRQLADLTVAPDETQATPGSSHEVGCRPEVSSHGTKVASEMFDTKASTDVKMIRKNNELPPQFNAPVIARPRGFMGRFKPQLYKSLLENFGFEYVMHFNEEHTRTAAAMDVKEEYLSTKSEYSEGTTKHVESNTDWNIQMNELTENGEIRETLQNSKSEINMKMSESNKEVELTELSRQQCKTCNKFFSNLWVLKNHEEDIHNYFVSSETIENFGQRFKEEWEKNLPKLLEQEPGPRVQPSPNPANAAAPPAAEKFPIIDAQQSKPAAVQSQFPCHLELPQLLPFMGMNCLPMHLSMNLMNLDLQNSLLSSMMMPNMDLSQSFLSHIPSPSLIDSSLPISSQQQQLHLSAAAAAAAQKRVRTRISDDQLKVLRQYFDINNSPTEEQVNKMADQTGLPQKVIKHWFRNTLFKERQRNKDSPYNFNNPPCTSIDLIEYDRTGKIPEIKLEVDEEFDRDATPAPEVKKETPPPVEDSVEDNKSECDTELVENTTLKIDLTSKMELYIEERKDQESHSNTSSPSISSIPSTPALSEPATPTPAPGNTVNTSNHLAYSLDSFAANMARFEAATFHNMGKRANRTRFTDFQIKTLQDYFEQNAYPKDDELEHLSKVLGLSARVIVVWFQNARQKARKIYENHPASESIKDVPTSYQRTSGQNYQCKRCNSGFQRFYELSKHQKHFCGMESNNNKLIPSMADNDSSFSFSNDDSFLSDYQITPVSTTKNRDTQNLSYPPKPQNVSNTTTCVIPTASTSPSSASSSSSFFIPSFKCDKCSMTFARFDNWQEHQRAHSIAPTMCTPFSSSPAFRMLENLAYPEHEKPAVTTATLPTSSSVLHSMVSTPTTPSSHEPPTMTLNSTSSSSPSPSSKRKTDSEDDSGEQPKDKRLRTTILPEQLDYLYQQYQVDCNPSRKQLEHIASTVNLKKRVVQVWFQNTRARERKGHYRAHQQLINKRCPFCRALFRAKSALESHLATKHPEQVSKGEINIDLIPDAIIEPLPGQIHTSLPSYFSHASSPLTSLHMAPDLKFSPSGSVSALPNYVALMSASSSLSLPFPGPAADMMSNASFEDPFFKKYMKDLTKAVSSRQELHSYNHLFIPETASINSPVKAYAQPTPTDYPTPSRPLDAHISKGTPQPSAFSSTDDAPLDLSKPIKTPETVPKDPASHISQSASQDYADRSSEREILQRQSNLDDSFSETQSEMADHEYTNDLGNSPPSPSHLSSSFLLNAGTVGSIGKRYRTQMSAVQVRVMKHLFQEYRTPTMVECEFLGQEIGLPKRVVQVWFQNARAKEKKAKLASGKSLSPEADFTKPPEECQLCRCKYTHKVTLQDHIFTKAHIDNTKAFLNAQGDLDHDLSGSSFPGMFQQLNEADQTSRRWDSSASNLQNPQLQSVPVNPAAMNYGLSQGERGKKSQEKESHKKEKKIEDTSSRNEQKQNQAVIEMAMNAQMLSALGGYMPGLDPAYLPYMYSGVHGYFPGMGLPLVQPGILPEHIVPYDPTVFGTPLALLQIPPTAIKSVSEKVKEVGSVLAQYTQDCQALANLHNVVTAADLTAAAEATLNVGYICKKCQMVYPAKESCIAHQRSFCVASASSVPKGFEPIMKLEQILYECRACNERYSTILEFKGHCQQELHKQKLMKFKVKEAARHEAAESPSSSAPYVPFSGRVGSSPSHYSSKPETASSLFNNNSISHNNNQAASPGVAHGMKLPLLPSPARQYSKGSPPVSAAFTDKHTAAFTEIPDIHRVKAE